ncbi:MAG: glycosyltransferase family 4 protein [Phycisphaerales bacterium]|nr:glycosyltransferase family 4 protein [Phycisphaerales bacterium]
MNTLVIHRLEDVESTRWPRRVDAGRPRVLFLSSQVLGMRTFAEQLQSAAAGSDLIEAVHVHLHVPRYVKALGAWIPPTKGGFWHAWRHWLLWKRLMSGLLRHVPLEEFDAIHVTNQYNAAAFVDLPSRVRARTIACVDATSALEHREFGYSIVDRAPLIAAERRLMQRIAGASAWSEWARRSLVADCGVEPARALVSRLGIPVQPRPVRPAPGGAGKVRIAFVGNHWTRKGGDRLLRWHQARWADRAELHLFGAAVPEMGHARSVTRHGAVPRAMLVNELLPTMDLLVHPTLEDTFVLALLEAQAAGVPVVASRIAGIATDVVEHGRTGFLCERDSDEAFIQATERLLGDATLRADMSRCCIERVRSAWDPATCADRYFREILRLTAPTRVVP